ncbi:MAG: TonB-linked SusC/RagA family outer membrane protein [Polaribacter sp.]|jgi:TonB-linked SusC/RagA family outer membrane protein
MKSKILKNLLLSFTFLLGSAVYAQKVTGTVTEGSAALPGVSIQVKGSNSGTETDFDGKYSINASAGDVLVFNYLGYKKEERTVGSEAVININLTQDATSLSEIVVIGYSTQTRGDITGSVASVDMAEAIKTPVANAADVLQGRVSGVNVVSSNAPGAAPKITIRGFGSTNSTDPLYIIDGVQTTDGNIFNSIDPSSISQMNVLKDGAAAIYGSRASNGVVIVTTKSGGYNQQRATFSLEMYSGASQASNLPSLLNTEQHMNMIRQSLVNDGAALTHPQYDPNGTGTFTVPSQLLGVSQPVTVPGAGNNWPEAVTQIAPTSNISMTMSNGSESGKYFMSLGRFTRDGVLLNTGFERYTSRLNSEFKLLDKLTVGQHLNVAWTDGNSGTGEAFQNALRSSPLIPAFDDNGEFAGTYANSAGLGNARNPVAQLARGSDDFNKSMRLFGDIYAELELMDGLKVKTSFGISSNNFNRRTFASLDPEHSEPLGTNTLIVQDISNFDWNWSNTLTYNTSFGEHNINALFGVEAVKNTSNGKEIQASGYLFETPDFYTLLNGGPSNVNFAYQNENTLFSIFGSVNYNFASKYFVTATLRKDTSSRFLGDNKSGVFPSASIGWLASKEDFWPTDFAISRLKLKASHGGLGNQNVPNPTVNLSGLDKEFAFYGINGSSISDGARVSNIGNADLRWETSITSNLGVELGFLQDKLYVSAEVYKTTTDGLIVQSNAIITTTGPDATPPSVNLGDIQNTGFDLAMGYSNETASGWSYGVDMTLSAYKNEVVSLDAGFQTGASFRGGTITRTEVGRSISEFYGRVVEGLDENGRFVYKEIDGVPGINDSDREYIGSPHADFTYGINAKVAYKNFDLSAFIYGSQGNDIYNYNKIYTDFPTFVNGNRSTRVVDSWTPTNTNTTVPALSQSIVNSETSPNSYFVEDGSFLRLKNIQLGYSLPETVLEKIKMSSLRLYVQATNLFTITGYDGIDPEVIQGSNLTLGVDNQTYPFSQLFTFGVNLKF